MIAHFFEFTVHKDNNFVSISDCRESVSNDNDRDRILLSVFVNSILDNHLVYFVQSRGSLIKQQNPWLLQESSGDSYPLFLST